MNMQEPFTTQNSIGQEVPTANSKRKILFDCDPGVDDALALALLLSDSSIDLVGITVVCGNTSVDNGAYNARALLELAGRADIPVARGAENFLVEDFTGGVPHIHGPRGLGEHGHELPVSRELAPESAAEFIVKMARQYEGELEIIAVGPLTNLAQALKLEPQLDTMVRACHVMGGAFWVDGNVSPHGEANIYHDIPAAQKVFSAAWGGFIAPLDATMKTQFTQEHMKRLADSSSRFARELEKIADFYCKFYQSIFGSYGCALHDPLVVGAALGFVKPRDYKCGTVSVDDKGAETAGRTHLHELAGDECTQAQSGVWKVLYQGESAFADTLCNQICSL